MRVLLASKQVELLLWPVCDQFDRAKYEPPLSDVAGDGTGVVSHHDSIVRRR